MTPTVKMVSTPTLAIAYEESGPADGRPVVMSHGFPDDAHAYDRVAPALAGKGWRVIVPYLRGVGPTRFRDPATPRTAQQAAIGMDLLGLLDGLAIPRATLVGYDWGNRANCIVAALWPERVTTLVAITGYSIQDLSRATQPASPDHEHAMWYQWYFCTERGRAGLAADRDGLCRLMWKLWSPSLDADGAEFARTAESWKNPDFVATVIHSYRHRNGAAPGDPAYDAIEARLAARPTIAAPTVVLHGAQDGVDPPENSASHQRHFSGPYRRVVVPNAGHFLPREAPEAIIDALAG